MLTSLRPGLFFDLLWVRDESIWTLDMKTASYFVFNGKFAAAIGKYYNYKS